jgi:hypothetical protein
MSTFEIVLKISSVIFIVGLILTLIKHVVSVIKA